MDSTRKPELQNPRKGAAPWSQLFFTWVVPILWKGCRNGLNVENLTECLDADRSTDLGDRLEDAWKREQTTAKRKKRPPQLKRALFSTFGSTAFIDGFLVFMFVLIRTLLPIVLAQFLKQFVPPVNVVSFSTNTTDILDHSNQTFLSVLSLNRSERSISEWTNGDIDFISDFDSLDRFARSVASDDLEHKEDITVSKVPLPATVAKSEKHDELNADGVGNNIQIWFNDAWNDIWWLAFLLVAMTVLGFMFNHHGFCRQMIVGAQMRIALCSLIYRKTLRLSKKSAGKTAAGYLVNLMSNDVNRLDQGFAYAHYVWILPFQSLLVTYLIYRQIGIAAFVGVIGLLLKTIPVQTGLSHLLSALRMKVALRTDQRVGIMHEIIVGIQVIKMYAWELPFQKVVAEARRLEIQQIRYASYIRGINMCTMVFIERSTLFITIWAMVLLGQNITADVVFSMAQFFNVLQLTAAIFYPIALALGAEALVSITRVEELLLLEERGDEEAHALAGSVKAVESKPIQNGNSNGLAHKHDQTNAISVLRVSASWDSTTVQKTLSEIAFNVKKGSLCAIIGPVGSGKSSLLHLLLGELPISSGNVEFAEGTKISYASQEPWLFTGTVRNNILFGQTYDQKRYRDVVQCCALTTDFEQLPNGDKTVVGERGASLSGGQRARISLARSVYKNASLYFLDDPLSAVDAHVGKHLFDEVIGPNGCLAKQKLTRLLVTHQVHFLMEADLIVILDGGRILHQGTYAELANSELDFAKLLSKSEKVEATDETNDDDENEMDDNEDEIPFIDGVSPVQSRRKRSSSDNSSKFKSDRSINNSSNDLNDDEDDLNREEQADGGVSLRVWKKYFGAGGNICTLLTLIFVLIFSQIVTSGSDYFVNYFTQQEDLRLINVATDLTQHQCLYIYGLLILGVIVICFFRGFIFFNVCMHASKVLHNRMFGRLLAAPMRFFDTNPSGRILNRFSKDMGTIDEQLPQAMIDAVQVGLVMVGILVMVSIVNPLMIATLCIAIVLFALILRLYLRPSQDLKRLEGICRSPVFSHLSASLTGISTIRSCGLENRLAQEFDALQDVHSSIWHLTICANTALGMWLDCVSAGFVACVTFSFVAFNDETFSGNVGLAISQSLILTGMVQYGVRQTAIAMQQMTSVERVLQYTDLKSEDQPKAQPPASWPHNGTIKFNHMSLRYDPNDPPTLVDLTLDIAAGWKVGIVGRTGAGKSSLISALFRLAQIEGEILIDGIDTGTIALDILRSKVSIIPQDPVLFSASIRNNLDPFNRYSDDELWQSLGAVELRSSIPSLDFMVTESGANFSVGQRQLICLARAILRNNRVLVLDEATANVDPQTDALIQRTIRERFSACTVLTVAHRLHTVMDSDRIMVMDAGRVREFDWPHVLLQHEGGVLRDMVEATGAQEAQSLKHIAAETFTLKAA